MNLGLCLSGGGIKGAAHIGVLKALEEENIEPKYLSGTSSGSIVACLYAAGYSPDEIYEIFSRYVKNIRYIEIRNIFKIIFHLITKRRLIIDGLNSGYKIEKIVNMACEQKGITNISEINMPLLIPSVDLLDGHVYYFSSIDNNYRVSDKISYINDINIGKAVRASCSYPGIFSPFKYNDRLLIDGGIRENIPWKETKRVGADKVMAVVFQNEMKVPDKPMGIINILENSFDILNYELTECESSGADFILKIKSSNVGLLDNSKLDLFYEKGYVETKRMLASLTI